jgi:hypothetical protein
MFANMQNYQNYKLQVHFCIFTSLQMLKLHVFILATNPWPSLQVYKFSHLQNKNIYKLLINNYNFTISQIGSACLQVHNFASMQACKFTSLQNKNKNKNKNYKYTIWQIASACLQVWKITKLPNHQITKYKITKL